MPNRAREGRGARPEFSARHFPRITGNNGNKAKPKRWKARRYWVCRCSRSMCSKWEHNGNNGNNGAAPRLGLFPLFPVAVFSIIASGNSFPYLIHALGMAVPVVPTVPGALGRWAQPD